MLENHVPPHMTVAAIETRHEDEAIECLEHLVESRLLPEGIQNGAGDEQGQTMELRWISVGSFLPQVLYVQPVLNEYLHGLSCILSEELQAIPDTILSPYYQPFSWLPHCTIAKQLSKEQMLQGYEVLQNQFAPFSGEVTKIGIAKTNPHRDIRVWELK
jgi:2'-5' RNA ligase